MSTNVNLKLRGVLEAIYERHQEAEKDARQSARSLGEAKADAQSLGADAKRDADHEEIIQRHMQGVVDIAVTVASIVMSSGSKGDGGKAQPAKGAGAKASPAPKVDPGTQALKIIGQNGGLAGAVIAGAIDGAIKGGVEGAIKGALEALKNFVRGNLGILSELAQGPPEDQVAARRGALAALPSKVVPEVLNKALTNVGADRREDAQAIDRLAQEISQAQAFAKKRRAKEQTEQTNTERAILELRDVAALA